MKKKIISVILCLCMILPFTLAAHAQEPLNYLLLGDSIAQGYGVYNRDKACYGKIVAGDILKTVGGIVGGIAKKNISVSTLGGSDKRREARNQPQVALSEVSANTGRL